jgi:hypothetical protein
MHSHVALGGVHNFTFILDSSRKRFGAVQGLACLQQELETCSICDFVL